MLATKMAADRFASLNQRELEELFENVDAENTKSQPLQQ
jgi:hypothetical protein